MLVRLEASRSRKAIRLEAVTSFVRLSSRVRSKGGKTAFWTFWTGWISDSVKGIHGSLTGIDCEEWADSGWLRYGLVGVNALGIQSFDISVILWMIWWTIHMSRWDMTPLLFLCTGSINSAPNKFSNSWKQARISNEIPCSHRSSHPEPRAPPSPHWSIESRVGPCHIVVHGNLELPKFCCTS